MISSQKLGSYKPNVGETILDRLFKQNPRKMTVATEYKGSRVVAEP
jgi:hypothetical protein